MNADQKIIVRLQELIDIGRSILSGSQGVNARWSTNNPRANIEEGYRWRTNSMCILENALGKDDVHLHQFKECVGNRYLSLSYVERGIGILAAAKEDIEKGYIQNIRNLVMAEVFSDLLDQAQELLDAGYHGPAAVLAGAVLEDNLRKLCVENGIELPEKPKMDKMNADLAKAEVYNKIKQKQVTTYAGIRNSAAHGKWNEFNAEEVKQMIEWVTRFSEEHLG